MDIIFALLGIGLIIWGADKMTDGAVGIANRLGVPQIIIGLTVVAIGTSAPELFVSLMSAYNGTPELAVGNAVGSNIFNVLVIVGITAIVCPIGIEKQTVKIDLPIAALVAVALCVMSEDGVISRMESVVLFVGFVSYMTYTLLQAKKQRVAESQDEDKSEPMAMWKCIVFPIVGLACLVVGGDIFVDGASGVARMLGVSEAVIGLTIVACGTSMPELATSIVAARKGNGGLAIGNVIGSNIFNIVLILGFTGMLSPMEVGNVRWLDIITSGVAAFMMWIFCYTKYKVERWEGFVLFACYVAYITQLIISVVGG